jgi:hypothetical protein
MKYMSESNAASSRAVSVIIEAVKHFQEVLLAPGARCMIAASTPSHPEPPNGVFRYTFDEIELTKALELDRMSFVVHHGAPIRRANISMIKFIEEHLMPFVPASRGTVNLDRRALADILSNRLRDWTALKQRVGNISLLAHGARINNRAFKACIEANFGHLDVVAPIRFFQSYPELAEAANDCPDCIAFGLRPAFVDHNRLVPALLDAVKPWEVAEAHYIAHLPIYLAFRVDHDPPLRQISDYLKAVAANLNGDALVIDKLRATEERRLGTKPWHLLAPEVGFEPTLNG